MNRICFLIKTSVPFRKNVRTFLVKRAYLFDKSSVSF
jgi:hypothetical protein